MAEHLLENYVCPAKLIFQLYLFHKLSVFLHLLNAFFMYQLILSNFHHIKKKKFEINISTEVEFTALDTFGQSIVQNVRSRGDIQTKIVFYII